MSAVASIRADAVHRSWLRLVGLAYCAVLATVVLGPALGPGYFALRDGIATLRSYPTSDALGIGDNAARAVPQDALVAWLSSVVDGGFIVKAILWLSLFAAAVGSARMAGELIPAVGLLGGGVAATLTVWNPYVAERLLQGHWSLLPAYAAMPWIVLLGKRIRDEVPGAWPRWILAVFWAGLTPTGLVLAAIMSLIVFNVPHCSALRYEVLPKALAVLAACAAPWVITGLITGAGGESDPAGIAAFAARAEPGLGTFGSLLGMGGIWNAQAVPPGRDTIFALVGTAILLGVVALGVPALWRRRANRLIWTVFLTSFITVALVGFAATGLGRTTERLIAEHIPGSGLLRDTQKWIALVVPGYALAASASILVVRERWRGLFAIAASAALIGALPALAYGVWNRLQARHYIPELYQAAAIINQAHSHDGVVGDVLTWPAGMYRVWDGRPLLDPAPRFIAADSLTTGDLPVGGTVVAGEGNRARHAESIVARGGSAAELAALGVRWVLVEHPDGPGTVQLPQSTRDSMDVLMQTPQASLLRIPGDVEDYTPSAKRRAAAIAAHGLWLACGLGALIAIGRESMIRRVVAEDEERKAEAAG